MVLSRDQHITDVNWAWLWHDSHRRQGALRHLQELDKETNG